MVSLYQNCVHFSVPLASYAPTGFFAPTCLHVDFTCIYTRTRLKLYHLFSSRNLSTSVHNAPQLKQRFRTNALLSTCSAPSFIFFVCDSLGYKMYSVIKQYICVQIRCGKSTLRAAVPEGNLTLRSTFVQRSHCSVAILWT